MAMADAGEAEQPKDYNISTDPLHGNPENKYKYIWLSFRNLPDNYQEQAPKNVKFNSDWDQEIGLSKDYVEEFTTFSRNHNIRTYTQWLKIFPLAEILPRFWSFSWSKNHSHYRVEDRGIRSRLRSRSRSSRHKPYGGSRRSLQKSRFLKRKSRKYKSIKKSKKRSFRNRGRH